MVAVHVLHSLEAVETVLEVADIAWNAYGNRREHRRPTGDGGPKEGEDEDDTEISQLQSENCRLKAVLAENLTLLQSLAKSPALSKDCPPDLYAQLVMMVDSESFLDQLKELHQASKVSTNNSFPFREVQGTDLKSVDVLVYDDTGKPTYWVWVSEESDCDKMEEFSEIDDESYVIIGQDQVLDGINNFIARCILSNPKSKSLTEDELHKAIEEALGCMNEKTLLKKVWLAGKLIYALSTWGIALAALYTHPIVVKAAARGITTTGKLVMKAF